MTKIKKVKLEVNRSEIWQNRMKWFMPVITISLAIIEQ